MNLRLSQPNWCPAAVAIGLATLHFHSRWAEWRPAVLRSMKAVYALVAFYVLFNLFIIVMIWYPPDHQGSINSYVTPGVSTSIIGFGVLYWIVFAKASPSLGYQIEDEEEGSSYMWKRRFLSNRYRCFPDADLFCALELADGTRWVTYKVGCTRYRVYSNFFEKLTCDNDSGIKRASPADSTSGGNRDRGPGTTRPWTGDGIFGFSHTQPGVLEQESLPHGPMGQVVAPIGMVCVYVGVYGINMDGWMGTKQQHEGLSRNRYHCPFPVATIFRNLSGEKNLPSLSKSLDPMFPTSRYKNNSIQYTPISLFFL